MELSAEEPDREIVDIERMIARSEPFDTVMHAIDALRDGDADRQAGIQRLRLTAVSMYHRPDSEIAAEIERFITIDMEPWRRLQSVLAACARSSALFEQYVEPLVAAGERGHARDEVLENVLAAARNVRIRMSPGA